MKTRIHKLVLGAVPVVAAVALCSPVAEAGTTIAFGSTVGAANVTSTGEPLDDGFVFQLGTFEKGFQPSPVNTGEWLGAWRPVSDREGVPLAGNSGAYQTQELGGPFPAGMRANSFSSSVTLDHNQPPFDIGGQLYIWGYDRRATPGLAQWILITDPGWIWPDGSSNLPAFSYTVPGATLAIVGTINGPGYEMRTAAVTVTEESAGYFEGWLAQNFSVGTLGDAALESEIWGDQADPDHDGLSNLLEYFGGYNPNVTESVAAISRPEFSGEEIFVEYRKSLSASGVVGQVEWSDDLQVWHRDGLVETRVGEDETHATFRASRLAGAADKAYFRLSVRREP